MKIRIRRILLPVLFCLAVACFIELPMAGTTIFGDEAVLWDTLFRAIAAVPVLYHFYREDTVFRGDAKWGLKTAAAVLASGAAASVILGRIITYAGIPGYDAAATSLLTGRLWLQLLVLLCASPLLEEFFFRGVLYMRLKELIPSVPAGLVSAALFGLYHGNPGQGLYAFIMGLFLAFSMEKTRTVKAPVLFHFAANAPALLYPASCIC